MTRAPILTAPPPAAEPPNQNHLDQVFRVLGNRRRCYLYIYLHFYPDNEVSVDHLITQLVEWEHSLGATQVTHDEIAIALVHNHLPALADVGAIDYDRETGSVYWRDSLAGLEGFISVVAQAQRAAEQA